MTICLEFYFRTLFEEQNVLELGKTFKIFSKMLSFAQSYSAIGWTVHLNESCIVCIDVGHIIALCV